MDRPRSFPLRAFGLEPGWVSHYSDGDGLSPLAGASAWDDGDALSVSVSTDLATFRVSFTDLADFTIDIGSKTVAIRCRRTLSTDTIRHLLYDQIVPRIVAHQGDLVLHAGAVASPQGALIVVGLSGTGKSTLTASMHQLGFPLLGDDAVVLQAGDEGVDCQAIYPSLRLFPDSLSAVWGQPPLAKVADYSEKLSVHGPPLAATQSCPVAVGGIFFLDAPDGAGVLIHRVEAPQACMALIGHSFWLDPVDPQQASRRMAQAALVADRVPVFRLHYPRDFGSLPAVPEAMTRALSQS